MVSKEELTKLTVAALKQKLKDKGLPQTGSKGELVERLIKAEATPPAPTTAAAAAAPAAAEETAPEKAEAKEAKEAEAKAPAGEAAGDKAVQEKAAQEKKPAATVAGGGDVRTKLLDRAKRFGIAAPELEEDKKLERAKRFGVAAPELDKVKKEERAKRFGLGSDQAASSVQDKILERAKRFGTGGTTPAKVDTSAEEEEKLRLRRERFGEALKGAAAIAASAQADGTKDGDVDSLKRKRAERFNTGGEADKKAKRVERFGAVAAGSEDDKKTLRAKRFAGPG